MNDDIESLLKTQKLNMHTLAVSSGLSYETVYSILTNKRKIEKCTIKTAYKICAALGITLDELYRMLSDA